MDLAAEAAFDDRFSQLEETLLTAAEAFDGSEVHCIFSEGDSTPWETVWTSDWRLSSSAPSLRFLEELFKVEAVKRKGNRH